ncbi:MAG TPA: thiazole synthase [Acidobacteriota bacterium]|nr:thiazole synthase [Acidobacteriota bacterium]
MSHSALKIGNHEFKSRLIIGTGKYATMDLMQKALAESGAEMVTVAIRRVKLESGESLLDYIDTDKYTLLPNTAGCFSAEEAIRTARLAREAVGTDLIKLEVIGDKLTLFPDNAQTVEAAKVLVEEGFTVLPYTLDDPIVCKKLEEIGCAAVMPLAAPIGSGAGIQNFNNLRIILEFANVPVIVDAGVGTASDACVAMEMGIDGILMNTAVAQAKDPVKMARAMRMAIESGRLAYEAGRIPKKLYAQASSPVEGLIE